ncbi:MAG: HNH endonuclease [Candidatus Angelobacter sp.]
MRPPLKERFEAKISPEPTSGCWLWTGYVNYGGYGKISMPGKRVKSAHRVSWEIRHGAIPEGKMVCHHCDVRKCVNPDHLFLGTVRENADDMKRKGRSLSGERNRCARLTREQADEIKSLLAKGGLRQREIAARFGISIATVSLIKRGKVWRENNADGNATTNLSAATA